MTTEYIWPAVALVALVLGYRLLTQWLGNAPRYDVKAINDYAVRLQHDFDEHKKAFAEHKQTWDLVAVQWRTKVQELEQKCDRVVIDAKNEIAGDLATVSHITNKGWR